MTPLEQELLTLLSMHSPTGKEAVISAHIEQTLAGATSLDSIRQGQSLIYCGPIKKGKPTLALYGHLDSIEAPVVEPTFDESKIYGLGASDMKGGLAIMIQLLKDFDPHNAAYNLQCVFYDKEEGAYEQNGLGPVLEQQACLRQADLALALEPTDNQVQAGCVGGLHAQVRFLGRAAHSARPWQGENALHKAWPLLKRLSELKPVPHQVGGLEFFEVLNATQAKTSNSRNTLPGSFELNLNYRFAPGKSLDQAKEELLRLIGEVAEVEFIDECPAAPVIAHNPMLNQLCENNHLTLKAKQAWTDIARLALYGIEAANFGPGQPAQAHQQGEWIQRQSLAENLTILNRFLYPL